MRFKLLGNMRSLCAAALMLVSFMLVPLMAAQANPPIAASPCDPDYFKSLKSRAWLEAQREITQNQNLIFKPDSVLEYTCFTSHLSQLARNAPLMFSQSPRWGANNIGDMDAALGTLVRSAASSYLTSNFSTPSPNLLGGRADGLTAPVVPNLTQPYACDIMNRVWLEAKCMDFINNSDHDGFYTFDEYAASDDHRFLPQQCAALGPRWQENIDEALNDAETDWQEDIVKTYFEQYLYQPGGGQSLVDFCDGVTPLDTGLQVTSASGVSAGSEKVCVPQVCRYNFAPTNPKCIPY